MSTDQRDKKKLPASAKMVQSAPIAPSTDDPLQYLYSSNSDDPGVLQVRVCDKGSKAHCVKVSVQGVPMYGVVDSGVDITIIVGEMFKRVAAAAKLCKRDFKPPNRTQHNYDQQPFHVNGRVDLDVSFLDKTMNMSIYVKMDAHEPSLLSEGVCRQMGIISNLIMQTMMIPWSLSLSYRVNNHLNVKFLQLESSIKVPPNQTIMAEVMM